MLPTLPFLFLLPTLIAASDCPWPEQLTCACQTDERDALSVVCEALPLSQVLTLMQKHVDRHVVIRLLHVNATNLPSYMEDFAFRDLKIVEFTLMDAREMENLSPNAFRGLENSLMRLSLINVGLKSVPVEALRPLRLLQHLDLSVNQIENVEENAFVTLRLNTLKLSFNTILAEHFHINAFNGLERSLNNLELKQCGAKKLPRALGKLGGLVFLDVAENELVDIDAEVMAGLSSISALNLERNLIHHLNDDVFANNGDTLASLSLLNNLLTQFPKKALEKLPALKVLDLGFNLLRSLPPSSFASTPALTLLALDGNPMATLSEQSLMPLNGTLKGLSIGSGFLECDCRLGWILDWMRKYELKVTSRASRPQFCGKPKRLSNRNFYQFTHQDLTCPASSSAFVPSNPQSLQPLRPRAPPPRAPPPTTSTTSTSTTTTTTRGRRPTPDSRGVGRVFRPQVLTKKPKVEPEVVAAIPMQPGQIVTEIRMDVSKKDETAPNSRLRTKIRPRIINKSSLGVESPLEENDDNDNHINFGNNNNVVTRMPRDKLMSETRRSSSRRADLDDNSALLIRDAYKEENSVVIEWESLSSDALGFRVVYRLFGKPDFKQGPPLAPSEREFRIKNVPLNECIVVCVVSLSRVAATPSTVPVSQCREIRTEGVGADERIDWIVVPSSAAIVATIIVALILFIACVKSGQRSRKELLAEKALPSLGTLSRPLQPPLATLASLGPPPMSKEWDQLSSYSGRSLSRARMYTHTGSYVPEDARSHISAISARSGRARSIGDLSGRHAPIVNVGSGRHSRNDLRRSRQSLVSVGRRSMRSNADVLNPAYLSPENDDSLEESDNHSDPGHSADNWTDYDQDIYMHRPSKFGNNRRPRHQNSFKRYRADDDVNL